MGSKTSSQQNQTQSTYALPQASAAYDQVLAKAQSAANLPYTPYSGELTASNNYDEVQATNQASQQFRNQQDQYDAAKQYTTNAAGIQTGVAGVANNTQQYMNPYTQSVINATMAQAQQNDAIQNNQSTSNAIASHAFGGDRAGIAQGVLQGQQALANNQTVAGLNQANYAQAQAAAENQQNVQLQNDQANRASIMQGGAQYANIESQNQSAGLANTNAELQGGVLQQQTAQAADTAKYGQFEQAQAFPYVQSNFLAGVTDATAPLYGSTSTGTNTTSTNGANSILGGVLGIAGLFSDERLKTDIKPVGKSFDGQTIHTFRYKDDPRAVHVGLMAQDVEKETPHAVGEHRGAKVVDYGAALRKAAEKGHFARGGIVGSRPRFALGGSPYGGATASPYGSTGGTDPYSSQSFIPQTQIQPAKMLNNPLHFDSGSAGGGSDIGKTIQQGAKGLKGAMGGGGGSMGGDSSGGLGGIGSSLTSGVSNLGSGVGSLFSGLGFHQGGLVGRRGYADGGAADDDGDNDKGDKDDDTNIGDLPNTSASFVPDNVINPAKTLQSNMSFPSSGGGGGGSGGGSSGGKGGGIMSMLGGLFADGGAVRPRRGYDGGGVVGALPDVYTADMEPDAEVQTLPEVTVDKHDDAPLVVAPKQSNGVAPTAADLAVNDASNAVVAAPEAPKAGLGAIAGKTDASSVPVPLTPGQEDGSQPMPVAPQDVAPTPDAAPITVHPAVSSGVVGQSTNADPSAGPITDPNAPPVAVYPAQGPNAYQGNGPVPTAAAAGQTPAGGVVGDAPMQAYADPQAPAGGGLAAINQVAPVSGNGLGGGDAAAQDPYQAYTARVRGIENRSGDPYATSSAGATGTYQFIPSTFNGIAQQHPELKLNDIHDPAQQERAMAQLTSDNKASLTQSLGRDPTPAELYLAHQQGAVAAAAMIKNPNARAIDLVSTPKAITGNGGSADMTAGQFAGMWAQRYDGTKPVVTAAGVPGNELRGAAAPSGGVVGTSVNDPRSRGLLAQAGEDLSRTDAPPQHASDYFAPMLGGTGKYTEGHSGGLFGLFPGMSDNNRMALAALGFGMAASPSKSLGMAIGQGGLQAVSALQQGRSATREDSLAKARIANDGSEMGLRQGQLANETTRTNAAQAELNAKLEAIRQELKYGPAKAEAGIAATQAETRARNAGTYRETHTFTPQGIVASNPEKPNDPPKIIPYSSMNGGSPTGAAPSKDASGNDSPVVEASGFTHPPAQAAPFNSMNMTPEGKAQVSENAKATMDNARGQYEKSQQAKLSLDQMDHALAGIPSNGFLATGAGQQERANIAKTLNTTLGMFGVSKEHQIDPSAVANSEEAKKLAFRMGADLATSMGGREPGFIVQQSVGAVPSAENSPMGAQRIVAGLRATAQRQEDRYRYLTEWQQKNGGDVTGADDAFNKANPQERYAGQAILSTIPQGAQAMLKQHPEKRSMFEAKYGPGTAKYLLGQ